MNKISVIIPVFNATPYIRRCLDSIIQNSYQDLEIICVDDGSTDNSLKILQEYKQLDKRIVVITKNNGGVSAARNVGLDVCTGDFIAFIDSDDWIHHNYFSILMNIQQKNDYDVVVCQYFRTSEEAVLEFEVREVSEVQYNRRDYMSSHTVKSYVWGRIYKRSTVSSIRFKEKVQFEDALYNLMFVSANPLLNAAVIDEKLYAYYSREGSLVSMTKNSGIFYMAKSFFECAMKENDFEMRDIFFIESIKTGLSSRYGYQILGEKAKEKECHRLLKKTWGLIQNKKIRYGIMIAFPFGYRIFRIIDDPSMLSWEKSVKRRKLLRDGLEE